MHRSDARFELLSLLLCGMHCNHSAANRFPILFQKYNFILCCYVKDFRFVYNIPYRERVIGSWHPSHSRKEENCFNKLFSDFRPCYRSLRDFLVKGAICKIWPELQFEILKQHYVARGNSLIAFVVSARRCIQGQMMQTSSSCGEM